MSLRLPLGRERGSRAASLAVTRLARMLLCAVLMTHHAAHAQAPASAACPPQASPPTPEQLNALQAGARDRGFLWQIERDGQRSWLYGTLHVAQVDWAFPGPKLVEALRAARVIALELDPTLPAGTAAGKAAATMRTAPVSAALKRRLALKLAAECLPPGLLDALPAPLQAATLIALAGRRDGLDPAWGIDAVLAGFGKAARKPVLALETMDEQLAALFGTGPEEPLRFVEQALDEIDSGRARAQMQRIARVWAEADLATLEAYALWCECMDTAEDRALMRRLLDDRNVRMAARIEVQHRQGGRVFAAVGSLHMIGSQGLPALLAGRGFRVERVTFGP